MADPQSTIIDFLDGRIGVELRSGALNSLKLRDSETDFVRPGHGGGLLRIAAPTPDFPSHYLDVGAHGRPEVETSDGILRLTYPELTSEEATIPVKVEIELRSTEDGLVMRAQVHNGWNEEIPQVVFPQLIGLEAVGGIERTRVQLGRRKVLPFEEVAMRPDDAFRYDRHLQKYIPYGMFEFNMKWLDYGDERQGMTLYSRNTADTTQGLLIDREDRAEDRMNLRWVHYPSIKPGETWDSEEYVLLAHTGDWYAGARAYQSFASSMYPYRAPEYIREALGIRTVWPAIRNSPPTFTLERLPEYAAEISDPELGMAELCVWHWWVKNGYPIILDPRLGTAEEFTEAIRECQEEMGVPVSLFVSHHLLRDTSETDQGWLHLNVARQPVQDNWTYGWHFLPRSWVPFVGSHAMVRGSALSPGWRETGLSEYGKLLEFGANSICFDQFAAWPEPNYNESRDGDPDEEGEKLIEFGQRARDLIHEKNPQGTFSGELITDARVPILDYTWEWYSGFELGEAAPFRYVFPQYRLNANVNEHPRSALLAFAEGALLNLIPGNMRSYRLSDCPDLMEVVRKLARLRRRFLSYFTEGQYRYLEGLEATGCIARLYTHGDAILVIVTNPTDDAVEATVEIDASVFRTADVRGRLTIYDLDAGEIREAPFENGHRESIHLRADDLHILEIVPEN